MIRSITRRLRITVAPQAQGTPIRGMLAITIGIAAISFPAVALPTMLKILGGYFLVDGVLYMVGLWGATGHRWRLAVPAALSICVECLIFTRPGLSQIGLVVLLSLWVIAMGAFRLRDAFTFDGGIRANWVLVFLSMLAIVAGCEGLLAPNEAVVGVLINVWIFPILNGITLITTAAGHRVT